MVCGMPSFANLLLQVGLLSSIASSPLSSATSFLAVSIKFCAFICDFYAPKTISFGREKLNEVNTP
jgi:hypothetical protein